jgi:hypothetical protein
MRVTKSRNLSVLYASDQAVFGITLHPHHPTDREIPQSSRMVEPRPGISLGFVHKQFTLTEL